jgi:hypothetical protein
MTRGPGWLFVAGLVVFALLGLLAGTPPREESPEPDGGRELAPIAADEKTPGPRGPLPAGTPSMASPEALARAWGRLSANWSTGTLPRQLRALARSASPPLAGELERALAATERDAQLAPDGAGSRGSVEAVDVRGAGTNRRLVVVTRESASGSTTVGLAAAQYQVYTGVAVRTGANAWRMAQWQRQP